MIYQGFLVGTALVLLGHAWLVGYAGLRLAGKALLFVFGMWLFVSTLWYGIDDLTPPGSLTYTFIAVPIFVCIEDFTRTWFVASRVRKTASLMASSLAFAAVASLVEIVVQTSDLIVAAAYMALELPVNGDVEFFDAFFSSNSTPLATVGINAIRPVIQYLLCVSLFCSWQLRNWLIYATLITSHVALDVIVELQADNDHVNYPVPVLWIVLLFALFLCAATLWVRANAQQQELR